MTLRCLLYEQNAPPGKATAGKLGVCAPSYLTIIAVPVRRDDIIIRDVEIAAIVIAAVASSC